MRTTLIFFCMVRIVCAQEIEISQDKLTEIYNDSVHVYNTYRNEIELFDSLRHQFNGEELWSARSLRDHLLTCAAIKQLEEYNHVPYVPVDSATAGKLTPAYRYPKPSTLRHSGGFISPKEPTLRFATYDYQTRFIVDSTGKTRIPYITKQTYDKGRLISVEKRNPMCPDKPPSANPLESCK